jgi:hypothetical protein
MAVAEVGSCLEWMNVHAGGVVVASARAYSTGTRREPNLFAAMLDIAPKE